MTRCDNCFELAAYTCADPGLNPVNYCENCIPVWMRERAESGHFPLVQPVSETPAPKKKAASSNADND